MNNNLPLITIKGNAEPRNVTTKTGATKTVYSQQAQLETEMMRVQIDIEVDSPNHAYRVGEVLEWDVVADLQPGQYGRVELARKKTLRTRTVETAKRAAA
jgi:hypothetical protein